MTNPDASDRIVPASPRTPAHLIRRGSPKQRKRAGRSAPTIEQPIEPRPQMVLCTRCEGTSLIKHTSLDDQCQHCFQDALSDFNEGWETILAFYGPWTLCRSPKDDCVRVVVRRSRSFLQMKYIKLEHRPSTPYTIHARERSDLHPPKARFRRYMNATPWEDSVAGDAYQAKQAVT